MTSCREEFWIDNHQLEPYQRQPKIIPTTATVICPYSILFDDSIGTGSVNITYSLNYEGPVVDGWPPDQDRYMPHYILPGQNTFSIQPPPSYFKDCQLLVIVQSRRESLQERQNIRDTWKHQATLHNACVIFIIGNSIGGTTTTIDDQISKEAHNHQDILQADMVDHYNNLTLKSVMMLKFSTNESNFHDSMPPYYLMKTDDDSYVNVHQLLQLLHVKELENSSFMIGHRWGTPKNPPTPKRDHKNKWFVPKYLFNGTSYPIFISGAGYITTRTAVKCLYKKSLNLPYFFLEDVFMGFAAENCRIPRYHCNAFHNYPIPFNDVKGTDILWTDFHENDMMFNMHHIVQNLTAMQPPCNTLPK